MLENNKDFPLEDLLKKTANEVSDDLIENRIHPLDNPKLYQFISDLPAEEKDKLLQKYIWRGRDYAKYKEVLGEDLAVCLFHPGIDSRKEAFVAHVETLKKENPNLTPLETIQSFSQSLGEVQVYRGMALTEKEVDAINEVGIFSRGMINKENAAGSLRTLLDPRISGWGQSRLDDHPVTFGSDVMARLSDLGINISKSISSSVSAYKEVATSVGWHSSGRMDRTDVAPHVFTIRVPKLLTYSQEEIMQDWRGPEVVEIGDKRFERNGLEIFVPFAILPQHIQQVEKVEIPPAWQQVKE